MITSPTYRHLLYQHGFSQYAIVQLLEELGVPSKMMHNVLTPLDVIEYIVEEANKDMTRRFSVVEVEQHGNGAQGNVDTNASVTTGAHQSTSLQNHSLPPPLYTQFLNASRNERIKMLIRHRLEHIQHYVQADRWHEAMALWVVPGSDNSWNRNYGSRNYWTQEEKNFLPTWMNLLPGMDQLSRALWHLAVLSDEIVHLATLSDDAAKLEQQHGNTLDTDSDITSPTWYMDRASVALLYLSTELYMLSDVSENFEETWQFLDRKVDDMSRVREGVSVGVPGAVQSSAGVVSSLVALVQEYVMTLTSPQPRYPRWEEDRV